MITSNDNINDNTLKNDTQKIITFADIYKTIPPNNSKMIHTSYTMKNDNILYTQNKIISFYVNIFHGHQIISFLCYHFPLYIFCVNIYVII
jgi:hypothetical protein